MPRPASPYGAIAGRTVLVTGAGGGLGRQTAVGLAGAGAKVVLAVRDPARAAPALAEVAASGGPTPDLVTLDLADLASVAVSAEEIAGRHPAVDVLVANAGVMAVPPQLTADGFELQLGTNHLGHFALVGRLLPQLLARPGGRVVTVSSLAAWMAGPVLSDLGYERGYDPWRAYARSKRANLLFTCELDRRARSAGVDLRGVAAHPGWAATDLVANGPARFSSRTGRAVYRLAGLGAQPAARAARAQLRAATDADVAGGAYLGPRWLLRGAPVATPMPPGARDPALAAALWAASEDLTGVVYDFRP